MEGAVKDQSKGVDIWVTYDMAELDLRSPKRKCAFSSKHREVWFVLLPLQRRYFKKRQRTVGTACGETSTFHNTYSKIPVRPLSAVPRLSYADKCQIVGKMDPLTKGRIAQEVEKHGYALCWQDLLTPRTLAGVFADLNIGWVFDLSPGSGTAALAAVLNEIGYEGIAANEKHALWVDSIVSNMTLAVEAEPNGAGGKSKDASSKLAANIRALFATRVAEARRLLREVDEEEHNMLEIDDSGDESGDDGK